MQTFEEQKNEFDLITINIHRLNSIASFSCEIIARSEREREKRNTSDNDMKQKKSDNKSNAHIIRRTQ